MPKDQKFLAGRFDHLKNGMAFEISDLKGSLECVERNQRDLYSFFRSEIDQDDLFENQKECFDAENAR